MNKHIRKVGIYGLSIFALSNPVSTGLVSIYDLNFKKQKFWETTTMKSILSGLTVFLITIFGMVNAIAAPIYLNNTNISVEVGAGTTATSSNNTFNNGGSIFTIDKVIDAASADATEFHNQSTHIWYSGAVGTGLELLFDFGQSYDLTTLHIWNYFGEGFSVDTIAFDFFDSSNTSAGSLSVDPGEGSSGGITAEDIVLAAPLDVQFVTAFLTGTNGQIDFQNIGFTASLSTDRCDDNPDDPICLGDGDPDDDGPVADVPEPSIIALFGLGLVGLGVARRRQA